MRARPRRNSTLLLFACLMAASGFSARAQEPFYRGKRLTVLINFAASGPTDLEGRLFAKYLARNTLGEPSVLVQNMDGAGGLVGAQFLGEAAPKDGAMLGYLTGAAWRFAADPGRWRVDFRSYEFIASQTSTTIHFARLLEQELPQVLVVLDLAQQVRVLVLVE